MPAITLSRRIFLSAGVMAAAGFALSGCDQTGDIDLVLEDGSAFNYFNSDQATLLSDVADLMIPRTDTVGAADTQTILYLDRLMQDWAEDETQQQIESAIDGLNARANTAHKAAYLTLSKDQRQDLLKVLDDASFSDHPDTEITAVYRRLKWLIFHIHYTSEAANPDFVLIP